MGVEKVYQHMSRAKNRSDEEHAADLVARHGSIKKAAEATGIPRRTLGARLGRRLKAIEYPILPSGERSAREVWDRAKEDSSRRREAHNARQWFTIKINDNKPIGVALIGDPHVDNPGTDLDGLEEDLTILGKTPGMYAVNGGDLRDNWVGRLARLYAESGVTRTQTAMMCEMVLKGFGVNYLAVLLGNHDAWSEDAYQIVKSMCAAEVPVLDWEAKFQIQFANRRVCKIWARHDFPGHSMWNKNHGLQKAQKMGDDAHIYSAHHRHEAELTNGENTRSGAWYWLARSRGYKVVDSHATRLGFPSMKAGATITAVIDPNQPEGPRFVHCYADVGEAAEFLTWKRKKS